MKPEAILSIGPKKRYAELLVNEIPVKQRFDVFLEVYRKKADANGLALRLFFDAIFVTMTNEEIAAAMDAISDELKGIDDEAVIRKVLTALDPGRWTSLDELARLRIENMVIRSIKNDRYLRHEGKLRSGTLATWATGLFEHFLLTEELFHALTTKLSSADRTEQDYVFEYFFSVLLTKSPSSWLKRTLTAGLKAGDQRFHDATWHIDSDWSPEIALAVREFQPIEPPPAEEDDIPF
jgi:hypothetical protein